MLSSRHKPGSTDTIAGITLAFDQARKLDRDALSRLGELLEDPNPTVQAGALQLLNQFSLAGEALVEAALETRQLLERFRASNLALTAYCSELKSLLPDRLVQGGTMPYYDLCGSAVAVASKWLEQRTGASYTSVALHIPEGNGLFSEHTLSDLKLPLMRLKDLPECLEPLLADDPELRTTLSELLPEASNCSRYEVLAVGFTHELTPEHHLNGLALIAHPAIHEHDLLALRAIARTLPSTIASKVWWS